MLDGRGSIPDRGKIFILSVVSRPAMGYASLLSNGCQEKILREKIGHGVKLTTELDLMPR
jgi:hypothetical protein